MCVCVKCAGVGIEQKCKPSATRLEEAINLASLGVNVDVEVTGSGGKTGDGLDICRKSVARRK